MNKMIKIIRTILLTFLNVVLYFILVPIMMNIDSNIMNIFAIIVMIVGIISIYFNFRLFRGLFEDWLLS